MGPTTKDNRDAALAQRSGIPVPSKIAKRAHSMAASDFVKANATTAATRQEVAAALMSDRENMTQPLPSTSRRNAVSDSETTVVIEMILPKTDNDLRSLLISNTAWSTQVVDSGTTSSSVFVSYRNVS